MWSDVIAVSRADTSHYEDCFSQACCITRHSNSPLSALSPHFRAHQLALRSLPVEKQPGGRDFVFPSLHVSVSGLLTDGLADYAWLLSSSFYLCKLNPIWRFSVIKSAARLQGSHHIALAHRSVQGHGMAEPLRGAEPSPRGWALLAVCAAT